MVFTQKKKLLRWSIIIASVIILGLFLWNVSQFFYQLKKEEQQKMEIWVGAQTALIQNENLESSVSPVLLAIIQGNTSTPMVLYSVKDHVYSTRNIPPKEVQTQAAMKALANEFAQQYTPIKIAYHNSLYSIVYYGNSNVINKAKYFPLVIIVVVLLFLFILYYFYTISKSNEQNKLWAGMAKETAHQIGTPLSSLVGWTELLKTEQVNPDYLIEMEKDVDRLKTITERFSKIGSIPTLTKTNFVQAVTSSYDYLKYRNSKLIHFSIQKPNTPIWVQLNPQLLSWTIENLVKNAADATRGKGSISLHLSEDTKWAYLHITDTGKGMAKKDFKNIFKPGVTSKKRGWGLGLSLAKRIVEEYHNGKIRVLKSQPGKGTTFEIKLKKI